MLPPPQSQARIGLWCVAVSFLLLAASAPAAAAPKRITGKLSKPGHTVIALAANGEAKSDRAKRGRFALRPPAKRLTLHLRAGDGTYAGPIVVEREGRRAIVGLEAGAALGKVEVKARKGYASVPGDLPKGSVDEKRFARAKNGVPIGAGVFGRVRSRQPRATVPGDTDLDGIPDPLDIDDDGDLVLDNVDRSTAASAAQAGNEIGLGSDLTFELHQTVNANAGALSLQEIDTALSTFGRLSLAILPGDSAELDCGGLIYCSKGGTGRLFNAPMPDFPECCDDEDPDDFGTLVPAPNIPGAMFLLHGATTSQIGTGDVLIERVTTGGEESEFPATLGFVFATVPAVVSYADDAGNSAAVSYPVTGPDPGPGGPGTRENGFPAADGPDADDDVELTLTFWRPQRTRIENEGGEGDWIDIGGLLYSVGAGGSTCPQSAYSEDNPNTPAIEDDPNLTPSQPAPGQGGGFTDLAPDQPASAANTFTYTLNVTDCLESLGGAWSPGETRTFSFMGTTGGDVRGDAQQLVSFSRQP